MIMTVTGPISPDELGVTMPHEHIMCDLSRHSGRKDNLLDDIALAAQEVSLFRQAGGMALVDVTTEDIGRNVAGLKRVSQEAGVTIIAGAGYYAEELFPAYVLDMDVRELAAHLTDEAMTGVGDTGIRPGIIGELRSNHTDVSPAEEKVLRASARTHKAPGLAISLHCGVGRSGPNQLAVLRQEHVSAERVIVGHADLVWDPDITKDFDYYQSMAYPKCRSRPC